MTQFKTWDWMRDDSVAACLAVILWRSCSTSSMSRLMLSSLHTNNISFSLCLSLSLSVSLFLFFLFIIEYAWTTTHPKESDYYLLLFNVSNVLFSDVVCLFSRQGQHPFQLGYPVQSGRKSLLYDFVNFCLFHLLLFWFLRQGAGSTERKIENNRLYG